MKIIILWLQINGLLLLPIIAGGLFMSVLSKKSDYNLRSCFGWTSVVITGAIGTPIHELSHMIVAILFGFKITDVKLFCPISGKKTGVLGYVSYRYRKTFWGKIGCFFVGIAPMIGGSIVIYGLFCLLLPQLAMQIHNIQIQNSISSTHLFIQLKDAFMQSNDKMWNIIIFMLLLIMISMHMSISKVDLKNAAYGAVFLEVLLLGMTAVFGMMNVNIINVIWNIAKIIWLIMIVGLVAAIISFCITTLLYNVDFFREN